MCGSQLGLSEGESIHNVYFCAHVIPGLVTIILFIILLPSFGNVSSFFSCLFSGHFLHFWHNKVSFCVFLPQSGVCHISKRGFHSGGGRSEAKTLAVAALIEMGGSVLSLPLFCLFPSLSLFSYHLPFVSLPLLSVSFSTLLFHSSLLPSHISLPPPPSLFLLLSLSPSNTFVSICLVSLCWFCPSSG